MTHDSRRQLPTDIFGRERQVDGLRGIADLVVSLRLSLRPSERAALYRFDWRFRHLTPDAIARQAAKSPDKVPTPGFPNTPNPLNE